jgi:hypothetical protein
LSDHSNARPLIIKRKKVSGGDGHHGGAWKVAMLPFPLLVRHRFRTDVHRVLSDPSNRHSDVCGPGFRSHATLVVRVRPSKKSVNKKLSCRSSLPPIIENSMQRRRAPYLRDRIWPMGACEESRPDAS